MDLRPLPHQRKFIESVFKYPMIDYFFLSAGYGSGKSFTDVMVTLMLISLYQGEHLTFGIGGALIKHLEETVLKDILLALDQAGIAYKHNSQKGLLHVGTLTFVYFSVDRPDTIFGHNLSAVLVDEGGELTDNTRFKESMIAISERNRVILPNTSAVNQWCSELKVEEPQYQDRDKIYRPGRNPFVISTTTAQGLDGVYLFKEYLRETHVPYVEMRAKTSDNPHISAKQLDTLRKLYTPDEARVYLDGEYLLLATGRVYAEYDVSRHKHMVFPIQPNEIIYAGQDFNLGYHMCVQCVVREDNVFVVGEDHWDSVGDGPRKLREKYPTNQIVFIPDASAREILQGWREEFDEHKIDIIWNTTNPGVTERVLAANKMFRTNHLFVFETCKRLNMSLTMRGYDDTGKPEKGKGIDALDHVADALEYAIWHIVHSIKGFEDILMVLRH